MLVFTLTTHVLDAPWVTHTCNSAMCSHLPVNQYMPHPCNARKLTTHDIQSIISMNASIHKNNHFSFQTGIML